MTASVHILKPRKPKRTAGKRLTPLDMTPEQLSQPGSWEEEKKRARIVKLQAKKGKP